MNSGRNLNLISAGIIVYLLAGADFQSIGVGGLSWDIRYPQVVKFAAVLFWLWVLITHWISRRQGAYYRAWVANSADKTLPGIPRDPKQVGKEVRKKQLDSVADYFGVPLVLQQESRRFALAYVEKRNLQPGIYVCQVASEHPLEATKLREIVDNVVIWEATPASKRYGLLKLHRQFADVFIRVMLNDVDVLAHRALPWLIALITALLLIANMITDVSELSRQALGIKCLESDSFNY